MGPSETEQALTVGRNSWFPAVRSSIVAASEIGRKAPVRSRPRSIRRIGVGRGPIFGGFSGPPLPSLDRLAKAVLEMRIDTAHFGVDPTPGGRETGAAHFHLPFHFNRVRMGPSETEQALTVGRNSWFPAVRSSIVAASEIGRKAPVRSRPRSIRRIGVGRGPIFGGFSGPPLPSLDRLAKAVLEMRIDTAHFGVDPTPVVRLRSGPATGSPPL